MSEAICRLASLVGILLVACGAGRAVPDAQTASAVQTTSVKWYFAESKSRVGTLAWLIQLDPRNRAGRIVSDAGMLMLEYVSMMSPESLTFRSERFLDYQYHFVGRLAGDRLNGSLRTVDVGQNGPVREEYAVSGSEILLDPTRFGDIKPVRFSSAGYSSESGDRVGADVEILQTALGLRGLMVLNKRNWGETRKPLALSNITLTSGVLRFQAELPDGTAEYELRLLGNERAVFHRSKTPADHDETLLLVKSRLTLTARQ